jgi:hypothetical protein
MTWLCAGAAFVTFSTICGLLLGIIAGGLNPLIAAAALSFGAAIAAYILVSDCVHDQPLESETEVAGTDKQSAGKYRQAWKWILAACFAIFALRSFGWLIYIDGEEWRVQSPNNLGDLALHITMIRNFANGVSLWPESPIYMFSHLRYPAGMDLFNSLFAMLHVDLIRILIWTGLLACLANFYTFYRWGGSFAVAGFLFNGGIVGFQKFFETWQFADYQGDKSVAWKSIPLSMLVTQRSVLYAIPVGLLLLWHWREKFFRDNTRRQRRGPLPFWLELSLYASMPLFHVHTFLALSIVLASLFLIETGYGLPTLTQCFRRQGLSGVRSLAGQGRWDEVFGQTPMRAHTLKLVAAAILPATFLLALVTDYFQASSVIEWHPGWVQADEDFKRPFFQFWFLNFGFLIPLVITLIGFCAWTAWENRRGAKVPEDLAFLGSVAAIFIVAFFFKLAPWGWDNIKLLMWAYFIVLPLLWTDLLAEWPLTARAIACIALFGSGFVTLIGGLAAGRPGYGFANRDEVDGVGEAVKELPVEARFAAYPTYNHPLLLQGRKLVLGYPGHLWTEGFNYGETERELRELMQGANDWREIARVLRLRYLFWGREETTNYPGSKRPWEHAAVRVAAGNWGAIYDLEQPARAAPPPEQAREK